MRRVGFFVFGFVLLLLTFAAWKYHFSPFKSPYARIPVHFTRSNLPYVEADIEGINCFLQVNSGTNSQLILLKDILEKITKRPLGNATCTDTQGNQYESPEHFVSEIKIPNVKISNLITKEVDPNFLKSGRVYISPSRSPSDDSLEVEGELGFGFLQHMNLFFDFNNSVFFLVRDKKKLRYLQKEGYSTENLLEVPFEIRDEGFFFLVDTDMGQKWFILNTSATFNYINSGHVRDEGCREGLPGISRVTTSKFMMGGHDFGQTELYCLDRADVFGIEGMIGMDFLNKHEIYLDCKEKIALIGLSKKQKSREIIPLFKSTGFSRF